MYGVTDFVLVASLECRRQSAPVLCALNAGFDDTQYVKLVTSAIITLIFEQQLAFSTGLGHSSGSPPYPPLSSS